MIATDHDDIDYLVGVRSPSPVLDNSGSTSPGIKIYYSDYVVEEILVTERQYIQDLADIVTGYLECSKRLPGLTTDDIRDVFGNIEDIYRFHCSFYEDLDVCHKGPVAIARCFVQRGKEFEIYAKYVTNYPRSYTRLTTLLQNCAIAETYTEKQLELGHGLPIGSYLHKPVQRILKYHLLLQNLLKHFPDETGLETISNALRCMTDCARHINEMKRSHEHEMKIQEIQSILYNFEGHNLLNFGKMVHEGDLKLHGAKSYRRVYLFEKGVILCKRREDGAMSCKSVIMCHNLMLIESIPREPLNFHIVPFDNPKMQHTLQAKTLEQKREWCKLIKKYMLESYNVPIPDKAKELLLSQTGKSLNDEKAARQFKAFTFRPHQAPEYIEKKRRKSQPVLSLSAGAETLPRSKSRVRKSASTEPDSMASLTLFTPPNARRSISDLFDSIDTFKDPNGPKNYHKSKHKLQHNHSLPDLGLSQTASCASTLSTLQENYVENQCNTVKSSMNRYGLPSSIDYDQSNYDSREANSLPNPKPSQQKCSGEVHVAKQPTCHASVSNCMPMSACIASNSMGSPWSSPDLIRRHSFTDFKPSLSYNDLLVVPIEETRYYDEMSSRARYLQRLLDDRKGVDDPTWSPQIASIVRRYRSPAVKRADSYSQAQRESYTPSFKPTCSGQSSIPEAYSNESAELIEGDSPNKSKTETSHLLNKLSQLKEKTSNKLTDLLKKSPVRIFRESVDIAANCDSETDIEHTQHVVGRRLSTCDILSSDRNHVTDFHDDISNQRLSVTEQLSDIPAEDTLKHLSVVESTIHTINEAVELSRSKASLLDEHDNQNDHVDDNTISRKQSSMESENSEILNAVQSNHAKPAEISEPNSNQSYANNSQLPELPPLPDFLLKKRLMQTMSGLDDALSSLETFANELRQAETSSNKTSDKEAAPNGLCKNRPQSDFWSALDKYFTTGKIDNPIKLNHQPIAQDEHTPLPKFNKRIIKELPVNDVENNNQQKLRTGNLFTSNKDGLVYKMARKYSTRIKNNRVEADRFTRKVIDKTLPNMLNRSDSSCDSSFNSSSAVQKRIESVRLRRTNSSRIKKFTIMLDSDDENDECRSDSGVLQCDFDSGSDCNDIYERQSLAALESFTTDDDEETRDSAIFSDGEDSVITSPVLPHRPASLTPEKTRRKVRRSTTRVQEKKENDNSIKRCQSLPRCQSIASYTSNKSSQETMVNLLSRPVSKSLLQRLESLKLKTIEKTANKGKEIVDQPVKYLSELKVHLKLGSSKSSSHINESSTEVNNMINRINSADKISSGLVRIVKQKLQVQ